MATLTALQACLLILGGAVAGGGGVALHQSRPKVHLSKPVPVRTPKATLPQQSAPTSVTLLQDCPITLSGAGAGVGFVPGIETNPGAHFGAAQPFGLANLGGIHPGWRADSGPFPPPAPPEVVPDVAAWVSMVFGFGLVGLSMRRPRHSPN